MNAAARTLPWDWHEGAVPENAHLHESAYLESSYSFHLFRTEEPVGLSVGRGAAIYNGTMFDVGPRGRVAIGAYSLINVARFICDAAIEIGDYCLISWNVVLMDSYRAPVDPWQRRAALLMAAASRPRFLTGAKEARPIRLERNVWVGFSSCILPGVTIGEGAVIGARSVVAQDVPPFTVVAGNPARVVRQFTEEEVEHGKCAA